MEVVAYQPRHSGELLRFLHAQSPTNLQKGEPSFFEWRFAENPLGSSLDNHYYLAVENNRIIGQLGAIRDRIYALGQWWDCCWLVDLILAPEHRGPHSEAALGLFNAVMEKCPLILVAGAGPKLSPFYAAMHCDYREAGATYFSIRHPAAMVALTRDPENSRTLFDTLMPIAGTAMSALQASHRVWQKYSGSSFEFKPLETFGDETDDLIERALPSLGVTSYRSADYLNWKFKSRPVGTHFVIAARRKGYSRIAGYIAVKIMERLPHGRWAEIVDYLADPADPKLFEGLLDHAVSRAMDFHIEFLRLCCSLVPHCNLLHAPFWIRHSPTLMDGTFFKTNNSELANCLAKEPWHLTSLVADRTDYGADEFEVAERFFDPLPAALPRNFVR